MRMRQTKLAMQMMAKRAIQLNYLTCDSGPTLISAKHESIVADKRVYVVLDD